MVWLVEKKVFYHIFDFGFRRVKVPIRVKFEFEVREGSLVRDSLSVKRLYNKPGLERLYPKIKPEFLERAIDETVQSEINRYLEECGYLKPEDNEVE